MVVLGVVWRTVRYVLAFPLWSDEAFLAINFVTRDLAGLARPLEYDQIAPPGFLAVVWAAARLLGSSEYALRLVPTLAGVAALLLYWRFCREVASRRVTLLAVAMLAASYFPVRHGNEIKPYTVDLVIALGITMLGWGVWRHPDSSTRRTALLLAMGLGVWCSYSAVFSAAGVVLALSARALRDLPSRLLGFVAAVAVVLALSFGVMVITFAGPQSRAAAWLPESVTWKEAFPPLAQPWRIPWWLLKVHTGSMLAYPHGTKNFGSTGTFLLVALGVWAVARRRVRRPLLLLLLGPLPFAMAAAALHRYPYGTAIRTTIYMAPAICLLAGEGLVALLRASGKASRGPLAIAAILSLLPIVIMAIDVAQPYYRKDDVEHRRLIRLLAGRAAPGDRWIVFDGTNPFPRDFPEFMVSQWVQRSAEFRFYVHSLAPVPLRREPHPSEVAPVPGTRTWLIIHRHGCARIYPNDRLALYQRALIARLGVPVTFRFPQEDSSSVEVWLFSHLR